jgi:hypothetical protein
LEIVTVAAADSPVRSIVRRRLEHIVAYFLGMMLSLPTFYAVEG